MNSRTLAWLVPCAVLVLSLSAGARADDRDVARDDEIAELKRKLDVVVGELETLRAQVAAPAEAGGELESEYGLGPAASKIYGIRRGVSLGGYAEGVYRRRGYDVDGGGTDFSDLTRVVLYTGYKFNDWIVFNTEIEFEHGSTEDDGSVSVEFATLDFLLDPRANVRTGLMLIPMGFTNEVHEPPFFYGTDRPGPERVILPSTWRENGLGLFGNFGERIAYRMYVVNGFEGSGFSSSGLRGGRQNGGETLAEDLAVVARIDFEPLDGWTLGGSYYTGGAGQNQAIDVGGTDFDLPSLRTTVWELHSQLDVRSLRLRGLWTQAHVGDAGRLSFLKTGAGDDDPVVSRRMVGGYLEAAYDIVPLLFPGSEASFEPFFRFEYIDTQNNVPSGFAAERMFRRRVYVPGVQWKPIPNVVLKLDYRNIDDFADEVGDEVSVGFGLVF